MDTRSIFVSIPSYRDPECQYTVRDLFLKARFPERVHIGICWQADREEDTHCFLLDPPAEHAARVRTVFLHHQEARGPCYARALIEQKLFGGEDFLLQLDSHYRMIEGWDSVLLEQLGECRSAKPILTTYPSSYTLPEDYEAGGPDRAQLQPGELPIAVCAREFAVADGLLRTAGKACHAGRFGEAPAPALFWAAGFAFSSAALLREVPYDPSLEDLFFGEESAMAARLWTAGWDFFAPSRVIGYHLWTRKHRRVFREHAGSAQRQREASSQLRVRRLLYGRTGDCLPSLTTSEASKEGYGLGSKRTLDEYQAFCGVQFSERWLSPRARRGGFEPAIFLDGDPCTPSAPSVPGAPILGVMPDKVSQTIQALMGAPPAAQAVLEATGGRVGENLQPPPAWPPELFHTRGEGFAAALRILRQEEVSSLCRHGIIVLDRFLQDRCYSVEDMQAVSHCTSEEARVAAGAAPPLVQAAICRTPKRPARLGREGQAWSSSVVRGDEMAWLQAPAERGLLEGSIRRLLQQQRGNSEAAIPEAPRPEGSELPEGPPKEGGGSTGAGGSVSAGSSADGPLAMADEDLSILLAAVAELRGELEGALGFASSRTSLMVARYPGKGSRYARHRDAEANAGGSQRRLTAIYYANPEWEPAAGGALRAYLPEAIGREVPGARRLQLPAGGESSEAAQEWVLDIGPRLDRLVIFASQWVEHEVLPSYADRYSMTAWFY